MDTALRKCNNPLTELALFPDPLPWNRDPTTMPPNPESPLLPPFILIVRAKFLTLTDANSSPIQHGNFRCGTNRPITHGNSRYGTNRCVVCKDHMKEGDTFVSHSNNTSHCIRGNITCSTSNVIYVISCRVCGIQYVGETRTSLKRRFYGHRSTVNTSIPRS